ncbi:MAG: glycosyltransferase family 4 protein [Gammaproteobacteria bacterium]|nr:glycosyltransferase family 4 protein [Gammaproteobacteria bacterium]
MRLMLVISSMSRGGAERVLNILADAWSAHGHQVTLVTLAGPRPDDYPLSEQVTRVALNTALKSRNPLHGLINNLRRIHLLRKMIKELHPDVILSFVVHTNLLTLLAVFGTDIPVIVSERTDPSRILIGRSREMLRKMLYPRAVAVVVQTLTVKNQMQAQMPTATFHVIPNPVPAENHDRHRDHVPIRSLVKIPQHAEIISAMGRLDVSKGFDLLIRAFTLLHADHPDSHLIIFGEGKERKNLERMVSEYSLENYIHLPGSVSTPRHCLSESDIFVLSSRFEGFPNALLEAMACGLPVISFDCPSGPSDIVRDGIDGLLVPCEDVHALTDALSGLLANAAKRSRLSAAAREVTQRFAVNKIVAYWEQLLENTISQHDENAH